MLVLPALKPNRPRAPQSRKVQNRQVHTHLMGKELVTAIRSRHEWLGGAIDLQFLHDWRQLDLTEVSMVVPVAPPWPLAHHRCTDAWAFPGTHSCKHAVQLCKGKSLFNLVGIRASQLLHCRRLAALVWVCVSCS
jgi:hypothetical protein